MKKYIGYGIGLLLFLILFCPWSRCQTVPPEVKQAIAASLRQSNTDGLHEEGGIWGTDISDGLVVIPAKPGKPHPVCMPGIVGIAPGDAADPSLDTNLKTILGEWHIHPRATKMRDHNSLCYFEQPPSDIDIANALEGETSLVIGAGDGFVYYYNRTGVTAKIPWKEFIKL